MAERLNERVKVQLGRELVTMPWDSRQALLDRPRPLESMQPIVAAFEAVGTSRPVTLKPEHKEPLLAVVEAWLEEVDVPGLPAGIFELRNALHDDVADAKSA